MKILILFCLALASANLYSNDSTEITGNVRDIYGKVPKLAHIQVNKSYGLKPIDEPYLVKPDGSFSFKLANGWYRIKVTGVDMQSYPENYSEVYCSGTPISFNANLNPNAFPNEIDSTSILTSLTAFNRNNAISMKKQEDGTYSAEFKTDSAKFSYQVLLHSKSNKEGRTFNGTMNDDYEYDGGGDYRSVITPKNHKVKIVFDPKLMTSENKENKVKPSFEFQDNNSKEVSRILSKIDQERNLFFEAYNKRQQKITTDYNANLLKDNIKFEIAKETNPILRELQMIRYLLVYEFAEDSLPQDVDYLKKIITYIKPNSDVWGYEPRMINNILQPLGDSKYDYINNIYEQHKDANVKSQMLVLLIQKAEKEKNEKLLSTMYDQLLKEYPGSMAAYEAEKTLNPNRKIKVGNQVPNFSFNGIDELEGKFITRETLKGKWVLIDNWATWCGPCIGELPELHKVYDKYKDKNFTVLSVSFDAMDKQVSKFRKGKFKMPWLHVFSEGVWESEASKAFEVMGIPKPILIDPNGKIVALEGLRGEELEKTLESMIK